MRPRHRLPPAQLAWLNEMGADTHWLAAQEPSVPQPPESQRPVPQPPLPRLRRADRAPQAPPADLPPLVSADLDALAQAVGTCTRCPLHAQRTQAVPGAGVRVKPLYFIVGEQPGIEDDASGQPFQGDSGNLLRAMMAAARLPEAESVYLTNIVKCRVVGGRAPNAEEIAACLPYLHREIALVQPRWILALGKTAAHAILGVSDDLDALRGGPHVWTGPDGTAIPVWVTHHPSSLLVRSAGKPEAWRDLAALAQAIQAAQD